MSRGFKINEIARNLADVRKTSFIPTMKANLNQNVIFNQ